LVRIIQHFKNKLLAVDNNIVLIYVRYQ